MKGRWPVNRSTQTSQSFSHRETQLQTSWYAAACSVLSSEDTAASILAARRQASRKALYCVRKSEAADVYVRICTGSPESEIGALFDHRYNTRSQVLLLPHLTRDACNASARTTAAAKTRMGRCPLRTSNEQDIAWHTNEIAAHSRCRPFLFKGRQHCCRGKERCRNCKYVLAFILEKTFGKRTGGWRRTRQATGS